MLSFILFVLIVIAGFALLIAAILGLGIGLGWLLTLFLPFTLFEGSVLGLIALAFTGLIALRLFRGPPGLSDDYLDDDSDFDVFDPDVFPIKVIPPSRFVADDEVRTWRHWFLYLFANDIYSELAMDDEHVAHMNDIQKQELAIRLADVIVAILESKPPSTRRLRITQEQVKKKMIKMGLRPYDEDILDAALVAIDEDMDDYDNQIIEIIRTKSWSKPSDPVF